jgi:prevent-host-death family protein
VGIDELRPKLGMYVRQCAQTGEEIEVTVHGIPAVRIVPLHNPNPALGKESGDG